VLRGSLVTAIGVQRLFTGTLDLSYQGYNEADERDDRFDLHQSGSTYAYHFGFAIDLAEGLSAGADFMLLDGDIERVRQFDTRGRVVDPNVHTFVYERTEADVDGFGARFGLLFYALQRVRIGVSWTTPLMMEIEADAIREETRLVDNDVGTFTMTSSSTVSDYQTPSTIEGALAVAASGALSFALQASYADWSQATIDDKRIIQSNLESVLRSVLDLRAGMEWTATRWPLRVRAGYARARGVSEFLQADRVDNDRLERVERESDAERYSLGAGWLFGRSLVVDAALSYARGSRSSNTVEDARECTSVSIGCGYWF
jgi:long-subunit fatty acid transport protein